MVAAVVNQNTLFLLESLSITQVHINHIQLNICATRRAGSELLPFFAKTSNQLIESNIISVTLTVIIIEVLIHIGLFRFFLSNQTASQRIVEIDKLQWKEVLETYLKKYFKKEQQSLIAFFENLWDKYSVSVQDLLTKKEKTSKDLEGFLVELGYK